MLFLSMLGLYRCRHRYCCCVPGNHELSFLKGITESKNFQKCRGIRTFDQKFLFQGFFGMLSLVVVPPVYVLVKNLENRLFPRQDAPAQQAKA